MQDSYNSIAGAIYFVVLVLLGAFLLLNLTLAVIWGNLQTTQQLMAAAKQAAINASQRIAAVSAARQKKKRSPRTRRMSVAATLSAFQSTRRADTIHSVATPVVGRSPSTGSVTDARGSPGSRKPRTSLTPPQRHKRRSGAGPPMLTAVREAQQERVAKTGTKHRPRLAAGHTGIGKLRFNNAFKSQNSFRNVDATGSWSPTPRKKVRKGRSRSTSQPPMRVEVVTTGSPLSKGNRMRSLSDESPKRHRGSSDDDICPFCCIRTA